MSNGIRLKQRWAGFLGSVFTVALSVGASIAVVTFGLPPSDRMLLPPPTTSSVRSDVKWITLHQLEQSLAAGPIDVVFDIDDTMLFTSAAFQWGTRKYGKNIVSAGVSLREEDLKSVEDQQKYREFWAKLNTELDQFSVPKWIAQELIKLHKNRNDRIHFVTKRIVTENEQLTAILKEQFDLTDIQPVIFTNRKAKVDSFKQVHAVVSYGDSDGDIRDSIAAGARPIRVMRARTSVNVEPVHNGAFGEEVLVDSEF
jgi:acid phosphatase (class B)